MATTLRIKLKNYCLDLQKYVEKGKTPNIFRTFAIIWKQIIRKRLWRWAQNP